MLHISDNILLNNLKDFYMIDICICLSLLLKGSLNLDVFHKVCLFSLRITIENDVRYQTVFDVESFNKYLYK